MASVEIRPGAAVVVTGASTGIGEACVRELDRRGCRVWAGVRSDSDAARLRENSSPQLVPIRLDVTDAEAIRAAAGSIGEALGGQGLAGLVNNAGIAVSAPLEFVPIDALRKQFEVNVVGVVAVTQALLPMLRAGNGRVVNVGSVSGLVSAPYLGPYSASKFALEALSDSLAGELRRWNLHVALVEPGNVSTPIWDKSRGDAERLADRTPPEMTALYGDDLAAMRAAAEEMARTGMPVARVVDAVTHALFARRPRRRYPVGGSARLAYFLRGHFFDGLIGRYVLRDLGLE